jgi:hypothetical protein|tara:strand:- start:27 stop:140 length:114 start_codon:yes stop_codon:yes gene_type:complete
MIGYFILGFALVFVIHYILNENSFYLDDWRFDDEDWD